MIRTSARDEVDNLKIPDRECPNGWECSDECSYWDKYIQDCTYHAHERTELKKIADETEAKVLKKAHEDAEVIKTKQCSDPLTIIGGSSETFWAWWGKSSPLDPQNITREPINAMSGAIEFSGGGNVRVKKSRKGNKPTVYVWGETL